MSVRKFTMGEVESRARLILLDTEESAYRFEPKEIFSETLSALERIRRERPASRYVAGLIVPDIDIDVPSTFTPASLAGFRAEEVDMERKWIEAAVYYVVHKMYLKDDPDTTNANLAQKYLELYNDALGG